MATPTPSWNTVRVYGTWRNLDGTLKDGTFKVTIPARVTSSTDDDIVPAGTFLQGTLQTSNTSNPSVDILVPATDDPDIQTTGWNVQIVVTFTDGSATENYAIEVPYANRPVVDGGDGAGVDLRNIALATSLPQSNPLYKVGVAGGLAQLDANGDVVDAAGNPVTGAVDSVNGQTGVVALTATDVGAQPSDADLDAIAALAAADGTLIRRSAGTWIAETIANVKAAMGLANVASSGSAADLTSGTLDPARLPSIAVVDYAGDSANQAAMLALTGQKGDWTVRTDLGTVWVIIGSDPTQLSSWKQLSYPTAPVTSVASKTGAVTLVKGDVGLGNVDNTSDATKNSAAATLTNKRITARVVAMADGATITPNGDTTDLGTVTIAGNRTLAAPTGTPTDGQLLTFRITQDATGSRTITWNAIYSFQDGAPVLQTTAAAVDHFEFRWSAAKSKWVHQVTTLATATEALAGLSTAKAVTPHGLQTVIDTNLMSNGDPVSIAQLPAGSLESVTYTGSAWPARPTSRTDIPVFYFALTAADPAPGDFITGTDYLFRPTA
jgi:hypothetical protein